MILQNAAAYTCLLIYTFGTVTTTETRRLIAAPIGETNGSPVRLNGAFDRTSDRSYGLEPCTTFVLFDGSDRRRAAIFGGYPLKR
ncbi:hypothetical protein ATJ93_0961 [Halopiger aswanensis]|uniref:Uncharacterized protein n=1 Tax=Halopiger aswanensis TaxID=148449 RepID=A0A3R7E1R9_9EURY|nr:hypothetical protein ATJ93_0961 [Halopiger aswanensis]